MTEIDERDIYAMTDAEAFRAIIADADREIAVGLTRPMIDAVDRLRNKRPQSISLHSSQEDLID